MAPDEGKLDYVEAFPPIPTDSPSVAVTVLAEVNSFNVVATDRTVVEDRWPPMDFPGLSTRANTRMIFNYNLKASKHSVP